MPPVTRKSSISWGRASAKDIFRDRIVSLYKPYLRPIVRGKENKPVEFQRPTRWTASDHRQARLTPSCTRLKLSVAKHKRWPCQTARRGQDLCEKGPKKQGKPEKVLSSEISKQRATVMEGVFGTNKDFYGLRRIRVEKLMIFFGIMTANAVKIAKRRHGKENPTERKAA
jgi:transposase, IS5 family